jgi:hypothetical protein
MKFVIFVLPTREQHNDVIDEHLVPKIGATIPLLEQFYAVQSVVESPNMEGKHPIVTIRLGDVKPTDP